MLRYARVRFWCRWGEEARRIYSPLLWRDDIERALQKTACILPRQDCAECVVYSRCLYAGIFMPNGKPGGKGESTPLPFAFLFPEDSDTQGFFSLEITLLHPWVQRLPYWLFALGRMKRNRRRPFHVLYGEEWTGHGWERFYNGEEESVERVVQARGPAALDLRSGEVMLRWVRPGRLLREGKPMMPFGFVQLMEALCRRVGALERVYGDGCVAKSRDLVEKSRDVKFEPCGLRWVEQHRFSRRQKNSVALGGYMGAMLLKGDLEPFGEILALGRDLGVGKGTGLGLGRYETVAP